MQLAREERLVVRKNLAVKLYSLSVALLGSARDLLQ
jgi:hypothetical protein